MPSRVRTYSAGQAMEKRTTEEYLCDLDEVLSRFKRVWH